MKKITTLLLIGALFAGGTILFPSTAQAESVIWSQTVNQSFSVGKPENSVYKRVHTLNNPNFHVTYNTRVLNVDTGQTIACGSKVAPGTKIRFEFVPHEYTDAAWFGTGTRYDSPYGSWNVNAGRSPGSICAEKNFYTVNKINTREEIAEDARIRINNYIDFSVNPPTKTISGLTDVDGCQTLADGNVECDINEARVLPATFTFAETFGQMYYGFKRLKDLTNPVDRCYLSLNPLSLATAEMLAAKGRVGAFEIASGSVTPARIIIPTKTIACQISVAGSLTNTPPNAPTVRVNDSEASCISGATISYSATAMDADTNPEDSQIRYLIDWDADGSADQIMPSVGYVPSNTPQTFSFVTRGDEAEQTFKVAAQDKGGLLSQWSNFTAVRCVNEKLIIDPNLLDVEPFVDPDASIPAGRIDSFNLNPKLTNTTCRATWAASNVTSCALYKNNTKFKDVGVTGDEPLEPGTYELRCVQLRDGTTVTSSQTCTRNPGFREI
jgi:hypothetical protein